LIHNHNRTELLKAVGENSGFKRKPHRQKSRFFAPCFSRHSWSQK